MDVVLTHAARIIYKNPKIELNDETFKSLKIYPFRNLMSHLKVIEIFVMLDSNATDYYLCSSLIGHSSQLCTRGTEGRKFIAFKQNRTADEMSFHFQAKRD